VKLRHFLLALLSLTPAFSQYVFIHPAPPLEIPTRVDGNSPSFWRDGQYRYLTSTGVPVILTGSDQFSLGTAQPVALDRTDHSPMWIESVWLDDDGILYGWYHHEPGGLCPNNSLTAPEIGAAISRDGGNSFEDLGIVLRSGDPIDCSAANGFFAGGHGDFSVILNRERTYFYFVFTNYGGDVAGQGVAMARLAFGDRQNPQGALSKYWNGGWTQPGIGGLVSPVFPARVSWQRSDTDSFWGAAIHWNTYLERYVVLLNRACCQSGWPQEGIYAAFSTDLDHPEYWTEPQLVLRNIGFDPGFYPQTMGVDAGETDTLAGRTARLYVQGKSNWVIEFSTTPGNGSAGPVDPDDPTKLQQLPGRRGR
jgi:hypothetical protein